MGSKGSVLLPARSEDGEREEGRYGEKVGNLKVWRSFVKSSVFAQHVGAIDSIRRTRTTTDYDFLMSEKLMEREEEGNEDEDIFFPKEPITSRVCPDELTSLFFVTSLAPLRLDSYKEE